MKLSEASKMIEEWMNTIPSPGYMIRNVSHMGYDYRFEIKEDYDKPYFLTVTEKGHIMNQHGDDCIETSLNAYYNDKEYYTNILKFKEKWYDGNEYEDDLEEER